MNELMLEVFVLEVSSSPAIKTPRGSEAAADGAADTTVASLRYNLWVMNGGQRDPRNG